MHCLREVEGALEHRDGLMEVPLAQRPKAHGPIRLDTAIGVIGSLGNLHRFLGGSPPLSEGAALGEGPGEEAAGVHGGQTVHAEALMEQLTLETRHVLLKALHRPTIISQAVVDIPQVVLRRDREANISQSRGNRQGTLTGREGVV